MGPAAAEAEAAAAAKAGLASAERACAMHSFDHDCRDVDRCEKELRKKILHQRLVDMSIYLRIARRKQNSIKTDISTRSTQSYFLSLRSW